MADKRFMELVQQMADIHIRKNKGYAGDSPDPWANFRMAEGFGVSAFKGCLIRMSDKFIRVSNLVKNPANDQVGENIKDTLIDLANYALIAICLLEETETASKSKAILDQIQFDTSDAANALRSELQADNETT